MPGGAAAPDSPGRGCSANRSEAMTADMLPLIAALVVLFTHGIYVGTLRRDLHLALDALPQELRDALDWPVAPKVCGQSHAHSLRRSASLRLAHWPLPRSDRIPRAISAHERRFRQLLAIENLLLGLVILSLALVGSGACIISLALLAGFLACRNPGIGAAAWGPGHCMLPIR